MMLVNRQLRMWRSSSSQSRVQCRFLVTFAEHSKLKNGLKNHTALKVETIASKSVELRTCGERTSQFSVSAELTSRFSTYSSASQERNQSRTSTRSVSTVSRFRILQTFLFSLHRSPLAVLGFDVETLLSRSHVEDTCTQCFFQLARCHRLR